MSTINSVGVNLSGQAGSGAFAGAFNLSYMPTFTFAVAGDLSVVYTNQGGYYSRCGNAVTYTFYLVITPTYTTASGKAIISAPVASNSTSLNDAFGDLFMQNPLFPTGCTSIACRIQAGNGTMDLVASGSGVSANNFTTIQMTSGMNIVISGSITYIA